MISEQDIDYYHQQGYLVIADVLSQGEVSTLRRVIDEWVERSRDVSANDAFHDLEDIHTSAAPRVRRFKDPDLHHPAFRALTGNPRVARILEALWDRAGVRMESLPVVMPNPEALNQGSIYENQRALRKRFFSKKANSEQRPA